MNSYKQTLENAISGNLPAMEALYIQYQPLIKKLSWHDGFFDEDLYQTLSLSFLKAVSGFGKNYKNTP